MLIMLIIILSNQQNPLKIRYLMLITLFFSVDFVGNSKSYQLFSDFINITHFKNSLLFITSSASSL